MPSDPWHFPRADLAERTLQVLIGGPARALALFAPRRTGKTEFLLKDLGPLAQAGGHRVIYASFWQAPLAPLAVLLHALEGSARQGSLLDRVRTAAAALTPKLELSAPLPGGTATATLDLTDMKGAPPAELLLYLDDLLGRLASPRRPTLLLLDEVQELARESHNRPLVAALRTSLDKHGEGLATVFTGSSREGLAAMFNSAEAPFFHFATPLDLPPLEDSFVDHLLAAFREAAGRTLDRGEAIDAFLGLHRNPFFFRRLLELLLLNPTLDLPTALTQVRARIAEDLGYAQTWLGLSAIQRAVALALAEGAERPFSQVTRERIGSVIGEAAPSISRVQSAIRKLESLGIADRWSGRWLLADPELAAWIRDRGEEGV